MIEITCINKAGGDHVNRHESISHLGWTNHGTGKKDISSLAVMVQWIEGGGEAYVQDSSGNIAWLHVRSSQNGHRFVQTGSDGKWSNNLLSLSECRWP